MSYILDALKKADADRHLGKLPGIHTVPVVQAPSQLGRGGRHWQAAIALLVTIPLLGLGYLAVKPRIHPGTPPAAALTAPTSGLEVLGVPLSLSKPAGGPGAVGPGNHADIGPTHASGRRQSDAVPNPSSALPETLATELLLPPTLLKQLASPRDEPTKKTPKMIDRRASPATQNPSVPRPQDTLTLAQLPPLIQEELPPLAISGTMYSAIPRDRLLLIDKRMLHEGEEIAPGVILEGVLPKGARLRYKGYVFQVSY
ncbi:MAG: hypothetical protein NVSMB6_20980 [Burkholderiaceae bacterium]